MMPAHAPRISSSLKMRNPTLSFTWNWLTWPVLDQPSDFRHLEPVQSLEAPGGASDRISDGVLNRFLGYPDQLDQLVGLVRHGHGPPSVLGCRQSSSGTRGLSESPQNPGAAVPLVPPARQEAGGDQRESQDQSERGPTEVSSYPRRWARCNNYSVGLPRSTAHPPARTLSRALAMREETCSFARSSRASEVCCAAPSSSSTFSLAGPTLPFRYSPSESRYFHTTSAAIPATRYRPSMCVLLREFEPRLIQHRLCQRRACRRARVFSVVPRCRVCRLTALDG